MDKNKIIEAATKFVQQGKYDKAIKEYQKALEIDPKDARIQQKLGELFQKKGENDQAADYFLKVAESYAGDGFALRAVAVYKQVLKLDEKRIDVNLKLAELYQQLGLMSDAMTQLQLVSAHYEKTGNAGASLDLLKRMVELDPDNVASRIKLAELYARDNLNAEAVSEFQKAATYLKRNNRIDDYVKVAERLVFLDPNDLQLSRELAQIYLTKQDTKRALAKLQICFKADPRDVDTLVLLAQAFLDLGQTSKTVSVYKELAKIYDEQNRVDDERAIWEKVAQLAPDDPDAAHKLSGGAAAPEVEVAPEPEPAPAPAPAPRRATGVMKKVEEPPATLTPDQIAKLLTETDVYVKYGLQDKALEHLKKIFAVDPDNVDAHDKQYQIAVNAGEKAAVIEERLITVIRLAAQQGDLVRARARLQNLLETNPGHELVPEFLQTIGTAPAEEAHEVVDDSILIDSVDEAQVVEDEPAMQAATDGDEMLVSGDADEVLSTHDEAVVADEPLMAHDEAAPLQDEALAVADEALVAAADEPLATDEALATDDEALVASDEPLLAHDEAVVPVEEPLASADEVVASDDEALFAAADDAATVHGEVSADEVLAESAELHAEDVVGGEAVLEDPGFAISGGDEAFAEARGSAEFEQTDEPPTSEQGLAAAPASDETDFGSLNDDDRPAEGFAGEGEGATRVVNLADLAKMREEIAARSAPKPTGQVGTAGAMPAAPKAPAEDMPTLARVPVARPPSRGLPAARPPSSSGAPVAKPAAKIATSPTMAAVPRPDLVKAARPESEEFATVASMAAAPPSAPPEEPADDPAGEELEEAAFFIEQGVFDEAREILETIQLAYPGNKRAAELMEQLEAKEREAAAGDSGGSQTDAVTAPEVPSSDASFDLAQELADELGDVPSEEAAAPLATGEDGFQISAEDVFAEFKKGVSKVVKPEDVDTHYDLGIAYKEMGLLNDAIGEFEQAMKGAVGKPREIDCHVMVASCKQLLGDAQGAVTAFRLGLSLPQTTPEHAKALQFDIAATYEGMGQMGKALGYFQKVAKADPKFREAQAQVERLEGDGAEAEDDEPLPPPPSVNGAKKPNGTNGVHAASPAAKGAPAEPTPPNKPASRKIGYV